MGLGLGLRPRAFKLIGGASVDARPADRSGDPDRILGYLKRLAVPVATVIDVGASTGIWSQEAARFWPDADYLLIEAQDGHFDQLDAYAAASPRRHAVHAAASDHVGVIHFLTENLWGGSANGAAFEHDSVAVPCTTVDQAVAERGLAGPYLLKLDTHGHEREILAGADQVLADAALLVIEAYNFANFGRMRFWELCAELEQRGFLPAGIYDPMTRPSDGLLWQMDMCFLPASAACFADTTYGA